MTSKTVHLCLGLLFLILGIAILTGRILPNLPEVPGMRIMLGIVLILLSCYRLVVFRFGRPHERRPYGGYRTRHTLHGASNANEHDHERVDE